MTTTQEFSASVDEDEIAKFTAMADEWWDPEGKFKPLHRFNPVRLTFLKREICRHFELPETKERPLEGLRVLDIGCGGGLLTEPMARLGADITGADASEKNISVAKAHADPQGLDIDYRAVTAETLVEEGQQFEVILNMEVIEHVLDPQSFLTTCAALLKPGGIMSLATLNRTLKSFGLAIVGAEHVLRWLPPGTHDWQKFLSPRELADLIRGAGLEPGEAIGISYNPFSGNWSETRDTSVNYMMLAEKPA